VDEIRVEKKEVTLHGSDAALGQAVAETNLSTLGRVPIRFVPNWLPDLGKSNGMDAPFLKRHRSAKVEVLLTNPLNMKGGAQNEDYDNWA